MPFGKGFNFWAGAGVQIGLPLSASYKVKNGSLTTTGHYEQYNWTAENLPSHGFYTDDLSGKSGDLKIKTAFSGLLEAGIGYKISHRIMLSAGLYSSVGLNNINKESPDPDGILSTEGNYNTYNGFFASGWLSPVRPFSAGIKLGIGFVF